MSYLSELHGDYHPLILSTINMCLGITEKEVSRCLPRPPGGKFVLIEGFWLKCGNEPLQDIGGYILTDSVRKNLKNLTRVVSARYSVDTGCYVPVFLTHSKDKVYTVDTGF